METKKSNILTVIVVLIGLILFSILFIYSYSVNSKYERYFKENKSTQGKILLNDIMQVDFENEYPSDEIVIELNNKIIMLIYGDMLLGDEKLDEIIKIQRKMFSSNLLELNDFDSQYENIREDIKNLQDKNAYTIALKKGSMKYYYDDNEKASVEVTQFMSNGGVVVWDYYFTNENGNWKINSWVPKNS